MTIRINKYIASTFLPSFPIIKDIVAVVVAGPAIKNTRAAPGFIPIDISDAAIGIDAVAHTYMGIPINNIKEYEIY